MNKTTSPRPGGRSARVQRAVHEAVKALDEQVSREKLTVPLIAERAGVTPSTIYRRWGNLKELLADVAADRFNPDSPVTDTGSLRSDLLAWAEEYMEEVNSTPGRQMLIDTLGSASFECRQRCLQIQQEQLEVILSRAQARGETPLPTLDNLMDGIQAPLTYRLCYAPETLSTARLEQWITVALK